MKKLALALVLLLLAGVLAASTLVLKGGQRLEVQGFVQQGNMMLVTLPDGRMQSYPLPAIDLAATSAANPPAAAPAPAKPGGPQSPFAAAKSTLSGESTLVVTDSDVAHAAPTAEEPAVAGEEGQTQGGEGPAKVELVSYQKKPVGEDEWELAVVVENVGGAEAGGVVVTAHATDGSGNSLGSGSGRVAGKIEPGKTATVTIKMASFGAANAFRFDISFQSISPVRSPETSGATAAASPQEGAPAAPAPSPTPRVIRVQAPPNTLAAPNQVSSNPYQQLPLTAPPTVAPEPK
ncbi:MAG TPA: hypothetical protein PLP31_11455 [Thermoanaerobaculaceae bacterium]|nr:hypothetical protein [Acidobacteriota bacterium]NLH11792.1 hypothetical protein [Holophagae bacterium]HPW56336.1 hypothetical protein [Thermoanaerobaculaceae bacterium]